MLSPSFGLVINGKRVRIWSASLNLLGANRESSCIRSKNNNSSDEKSYVKVLFTITVHVFTLMCLVRIFGREVWGGRVGRVNLV